MLIIIRKDVKSFYRKLRVRFFHHCYLFDPGLPGFFKLFFNTPKWSIAGRNRKELQPKKRSRREALDVVKSETEPEGESGGEGRTRDKIPQISKNSSKEISQGPATKCKGE